jgi:hypothetical protein
MLDARPPCRRVSLVSIYRNAFDCALSVYHTRVNLIRVRDLTDSEDPIFAMLALYHRPR